MLHYNLSSLSLCAPFRLLRRSGSVRSRQSPSGKVTSSPIRSISSPSWWMRIRSSPRRPIMCELRQLARCSPCKTDSGQCDSLTCWLEWDCCYLWLCSRIAAILLPLDLPCTSVSGQISSLLIWLNLGSHFPCLDDASSEPGLGIQWPVLWQLGCWVAVIQKWRPRPSLSLIFLPSFCFSLDTSLQTPLASVCF